jgi:hypothetical protein
MKEKEHAFRIAGAVCALALALVLQGCAQALQPAKPAVPGRPPVITRVYAPEMGYYGNILRIYLEADDPDQDMLRIAVVVDQMGYGHYPADWIYLKHPTSGHFIGYLQWNTASASGSYIPEWTQITIKVSVFDRAGQESNVVVIPYEFASGIAQYPPPPPPFDRPDLPRLGHIDINLVNPFQNDAHDFRF